DLDARHVGGDGFELAADVTWGIRFEVEHILRGRTPEEVKQDYALGFAGTPLIFGVRLGRQQVRQSKEAAQEGQGPRLQSLATGQAVAAAPRAAQHGNAITHFPSRLLLSTRRQRDLSLHPSLHS